MTPDCSRTERRQFEGDLVEDAANVEVGLLRLAPAAEGRVVNGHEVDLREQARKSMLLTTAPLALVMRIKLPK